MLKWSQVPCRFSRVRTNAEPSRAFHPAPSSRSTARQGSHASRSHEFSEALVALETVILTLLGVSAVIVIVLAGLMMRDMGESQRSQGGAYYVGFFALFVLGAIFSKFVTVMVRRRDRRRTDE